MSGDRYRDWDAAYVLGSLAPEEHREYEAHLAGCANCSAAVAELTGVPGVLGRLDTESALRIRDLPSPAAGDGEAPAPAAVARIAGRIQRRRRFAAALGTAAVVAALAGGIGVGSSLTAAPPTSTATAAELRPVGASAVSAHLTMTTIPEGTRLEWRCRYPEDGAWGGTPSYRLVVRTTDGDWKTVATWTAGGKDADGLSTVTSIRREDIRAVQIRLPDSPAALASADL